MTALATLPRPPHPALRLAPQVRAEVANLMRAMGTVFAAGADGVNPGMALDARQRDGEDATTLRSVLRLLTRATQSPASTGNEEWAGALVAPAITTALLDMLADQGTVAAQLPFARLNFEGGSLRVPYRKDSGEPNLAAAFRLEGAPIRVGAMTLDAQLLAAKSMAVISTASAEMVSAAGTGVMDQVMRSGMLTDTARVLDGLMFDDQPADAKRPAGLANYATGDNTAASTGTDAASISADLKARVDAMVSAGFGGPAARWVMNTLHAATLAELFTETQMRDTFLRIPIVSGHMVPPGTVFLIDCAAVAFVADAPAFASATEAVLHEESDPTALMPLDTAAPARSLWQTNVTGLRLVWPLNWAVGGAGAVQTLTGVTW